MEEGIGTKILPEAITWHFAGTWDHMPELVSARSGDLASRFTRSAELLGRSVALPVNVLMDEEMPERAYRALIPELR